MKNFVHLLQVRKNHPAFEQLYEYAKIQAYAKIEENYVIVPIDTRLVNILLQHESLNQQNYSHLMLVNKEEEQ